jgi:hypothetical protein
MTAEDENSKRWNGSRPFEYLTSDHPVLAATQMIIGSVPQCRPTSGFVHA